MQLHSQNRKICKSKILDAIARKFPNKIELLSAALIDVREDLTFDIDPISYNMISVIDAKQYTSLNIIECLDGKNDQKSLHSKADLEF